MRLGKHCLEFVGTAAVAVVVVGLGPAVSASGTTPPPSITGTVTAADGTPLAGICVSASWFGGGLGDVTGSDGTYSLPGGSASETVTVRFGAGSLCQDNFVNGSDYALQYYNGTAGGTADPASATPITIQPDQTVSDVDAVMAAGGSITGTVKWAEGSTPIPGACVQVLSDTGSPLALVEAANDGTYDIDGLDAGSYLVSFFPSPSACASEGADTLSYTTQWYHGAATAPGATPVAVTAGAVTGGIDATVTNEIGFTPTTATVGASPTSATPGQGVTYSARVAGADGTPTGSVTFFVGETALCTASFTGGTGSCISGTAPTGVDTVTGQYAGDATFVGSSATASLTVSAPAPPVTPPPPTTSPASPATSGYDLVGQDGGVFVFPTGPTGGYYGSLPGLGVHVSDITGIVPSPDDEGYFLVGRDGGVFAFGDADYLGSLPGLHVSVDNIKGIVPTSDNRGYFLVGADGGVFAFGDADYLGSLPGDGIHRSDIIGIAANPSDHGYWLVAADGTVYAFRNAAALGSAHGTPSPVSSIASTPDGGGYWIVTQDGGVYPFGDAESFGSLPALGATPAHPVIGLVPTADDSGYWLIGSDGGIFAFGDAPFVGSLPGLGVHVSDIVGAVPTSS
jgi:hypothetical protein